MIDEVLLQVLACPKCESRPPVRQEGMFLVCTECEWGYPIREGIPYMLPEDAVPKEEWQKEVKEHDAGA
ncbi:MAG: hypothetical protein K6T17_01120 [Fimbriimonadales bacterium]|nr:hypothetical protein [Fimbriimonadales bacterium]